MFIRRTLGDLTASRENAIIMQGDAQPSISPLKIMWISEEEASIRIGSHRNILNRIDRDSRPSGDTTPAPIEPFAPDNPLPLDPEVIHHVEQSKRRTRTQPNLTQREAADAVLIGQLTDRKNAATLYGVNDDHIRLMTDRRSQSHDKKDTPGLVEIIESQRTKIRDLAFKRLGTVLECLDEKKIRGIEKARELATVGAQLAVISEKMLPREMARDENVHFHMFRPEVKKESDYEMVEVGEARESLKLLEGEVATGTE